MGSILLLTTLSNASTTKRTSQLPTQTSLSKDHSAEGCRTFQSPAQATPSLAPLMGFDYAPGGIEVNVAFHHLLDRMTSADTDLLVKNLKHQVNQTDAKAAVLEHRGHPNSDEISGFDVTSFINIKQICRQLSFFSSKKGSPIYAFRPNKPRSLDFIINPGFSDSCTELQTCKPIT
ncbi:hypothetical protein P7K49_031927 [Saguinus oedipus]|uniref:Uncharacterized protein n=1 Tax=Saguinus oedipus TaxID=9490 RepID=A0ABQ9U1P3_SAGOE|nr:hypothetical protein P7K49_031927 [Saguinus oedipus]